jgi:FtsP/CotA-like multicopper oxidase with cupredoxin domain
VWAYNAIVPGPEIRVRQGERARVVVENRLAEETTVHFHGIRLPNAMDGVPHLTQPPIAPGGTFTYELPVPDAGTYWYHPHVNSAVQLGRGLSGPFIVEEREPIPVDRDVVWMLSDWRLLPNAQIRGDFGNLHDMAHNGRIGETVTINGRVPDTFVVRGGERIRLRLINAANARVFALKLTGHRPPERVQGHRQGDPQHVADQPRERRAGEARRLPHHARRRLRGGGPCAGGRHQQAAEGAARHQGHRAARHA